MTSALLTDEAGREAILATEEQMLRLGWSPATAHDAARVAVRDGVPAVLDHHRTVGREALVEKVEEALFRAGFLVDDRTAHRAAEAVVTALVGVAPSKA